MQHRLNGGEAPDCCKKMSLSMIRWLFTLVLLDSGNLIQATVDQCWTPWFDRDNPSGSGDFETLPKLLKENPEKICKRPIEIEVQTASGAIVSSTGDVIHVTNVHRGFVCRNRDQPGNSRCEDYKVRFLCPVEFCNPKECWTPWFDRDNPSGTGDHETLVNLHKENPGKICDYPINIEVQTISGASVGSTGDVIHTADASTGFACRNHDQPHNRLCADYKVRFLCPLEFCEPEECKTPWYDRDNPSGTGDFEILEKLYLEHPKEICSFPLNIEVQTVAGNTVASTGDAIAVADVTTGFICKNADQKSGHCSDYKVRFVCPIAFCKEKECWTPWFDRDNPSGTGDYETLADLLKENPGKVCEHPIEIEVKTKSGASVGTTGDVIHTSNAHTGFICRNRDQLHDGLCADYQVRFLCPVEFCKAKECKTPWYDRDNPSGTGDFEILEKLYIEHPNEICQFPLDIEVQTVTGNTLASTGDAISIVDATTGFICKNVDQKTGRCSDYKVRFTCPIDFCKKMNIHVK
ncbi:mucin-5AC-like isoform X2 [Syngnathoides biaculeatus]|uniref:mucin-5AC-like isoform X2 n=1 Tax=Syngnathoides biaculeatus TaxID=300417 RepID=UPI002ADDE297|nr:mucin-5AC-like isoform X2 [Syngnathoides biaculeatus]